jgi:FlaA1/EpsC-like NDP-sugar epimerase
MNKIINFLISRSNFGKRALIVITDIVLVLLSLWIALSLENKNIYFPDNNSFNLFLVSLVVAIPIFALFDLYRSIIRYMGFIEMWSITKAVTLFSTISYSLNSFIQGEFLSLTLFFSFWLICLVLVSISRLAASSLLLEKFVSSNIVIFGAGAAGRQLSSALRYSRELKPVAFVDEDKSLQGNFLNGIKVFSPSQLPKLIPRKKIFEVLIAIPSAKKHEISRIVSSISEIPVKVRVLPGVAELAQGKISVSDLKPLEVADLLGREPVKAQEDLLKDNIQSKVVMVTGAGGSIGSELCRQILKIKPKLLVLFEISEVSLYLIEQELINDFERERIKTVLGNVCDKDRVKEVCEQFRVDTIYHAAAYKQVPMVEMNTLQSFENNVFGTLNCALSALETEVETFVLVSTDKAVRPTSFMGATKRFAELILQALSDQQSKSSSKSGIKFTMVRFGNVLGSSASVVPLFREQIEKGGPVTVTDPEVVRYFMSITESAELVIQAGSLAKGGEVFLLDMGEPIKIFELAEKMIRLSGFERYNPETKEGDIEITFSGLRDGEKLYEELLIGNDATETRHELIFKANEERLEWKEIERLIEEFKEAVQDRNEKGVHDLLIGSISGYKPHSGLKDLIYISKGHKDLKD